MTAPAVHGLLLVLGHWLKALWSPPCGDYTHTPNSTDEETKTQGGEITRGGQREAQGQCPA